MNKKITLIFVSIILVLSMGAVKGAEGIDITSSDKRVIIGDSREIPVTLKNNANDEYARVDMVIWKLMDEVNGSETLIGKGTIKGNKTINGIRLDMEDNKYDNMDIDDEKTKQLRVTANETAVAGDYTVEFVVYGMKKGNIDYHYPSMGLEISDDPFDLNNGEIRVVGRGGKEAYPGDTISADLKITNHYSETSEIDVKLGFYGKETKIYQFKKEVPSGTNIIPVKTEVPKIEHGEYNVKASFTGKIVKDEEKWSGSEITLSDGINLETFSISNNVAETWEENNAIFSVTNYRKQKSNIKLRVKSENGQINIEKPIELSTGSSTHKISLKNVDPGQYEITGSLIEEGNIINSKTKELEVLKPLEVKEPEINKTENQDNSKREINVNTTINNPREETITASVSISIKNTDTNETIYNPPMQNVALEPGNNNYNYSKKLPKGNYTVYVNLNYKDNTKNKSGDLDLELLATGNNENQNQTNTGLPGTNGGFPWIYIIIPLIAVIIAIYLIINKEPEEGPERKSPLGRDRQTSMKTEQEQKDRENKKDGLPNE